jgi:hypothetical protein
MDAKHRFKETEMQNIVDEKQSKKDAIQGCLGLVVVGVIAFILFLGLVVLANK